MSKGIFSSFNENDKLFEFIEKENPIWWQNIIEDDELYIELRKDNYINVYYYGGCVAKISYKRELKAMISNKYLDSSIEGQGSYVDCLGKLESKSEIDDIKFMIKEVYLKKEKNAKEKIFQGDFKLMSKDNYIDSEFAYNSEEQRVRIDLVKLENGLLTFVELKLITNEELTSRSKVNNEIKIINQMNKYSEFILDYKDEFIPYYKKILLVKKRLGIINDIPEINNVNQTPLLLIFNTYINRTKGQDGRIANIHKIISKKNFDFKIR